MGVIDLNAFKENIQTVLQQQNTTGASIIDLSSGLTNRITKVFKKHPRHLVSQASEMPLVTVFLEGKKPENKTIAPTRQLAKRQGEVRVNIAAMFYDNNFQNNDDDEAEDDLEAVMENIEEIISRDPTLGGVCDWIKPEDVVYFTIAEDQAAMLTGVFSFTASKFY